MMMCVVRCGFKNGLVLTKKGIMCLKEIGLRARDLLTILGSIVNTVRWTYVVRRSKALLRVLHAYLRVGCTMKNEPGLPFDV